MLLLAVLVLPSALAQSCGDYVNSDITLSANLTDCAGNALVVNSSNVILDCDGYWITKASPFDSYGVLVNGFDNVTIKNCNIRLFSQNIRIASANDIWVMDNDLTNSTYAGVYSQNSDNINVLRNIIHGNNTQRAVYFAFNVNNSQIINNSIKDSRFYGTLVGGGNVLIQGNNYTDCIGQSLAVTSSKDVQLVENIITGTTGTGIGLSSLFEELNISIIKNTIYNNSQGISVGDGTFFIRNNTLFNNTDKDLYFNSVTNNPNIVSEINNLKSPDQTQNIVLSISDNSFTTMGFSWNETNTVPSNYLNFKNKTFKIIGLSSLQINSLKVHWDESELSGYDETRFELWEYNSGSWTNKNAILNITSNTLSLTNSFFYPGRVYSILEKNIGPNITQCENITSPGNYVLQNSVFSVDQDCFRITDVENINFDCNGYTINTNGYNALYTENTNNITFKNCSISEESYFYLGINSSNTTIISSVENKSIDALINDNDCWIPYPGTSFSSGNYEWCDGNYIYDLNSVFAIKLEDNVYINASDVYVIGNNKTGWFMEFSQDQTNITLDGLDISFFELGILLSSSNSYILSNNVHNNSLGIFVNSGSENVFNNNIISNNDRGSLLGLIVDFDMFNNVFENNGYGVTTYLDLAEEYLTGLELITNTSFGTAGIQTSQIINNSFVNNINSGLTVLLLGNDNIIHGNNFSSNQGFGAIIFSGGNSVLNITKNEINYNNMSGMLVFGNEIYFAENDIFSNGDGITMPDEKTLYVFNNITETFVGESIKLSNALLYSGVVFDMGTNTNIVYNNSIIDNYYYGLVVWDQSSPVNLFYNYICNNTIRGGLNISQVMSLGIEFNASSTDPYFNTYCDNNLRWYEMSSKLNVFFSPIDADVIIRSYPSGEIYYPLYNETGFLEYYLPQYYIYNNTPVILNIFSYDISKSGYDSKTGIVVMSSEQNITESLSKIFVPSIICPVNSTSNICGLMVESGAGLGAFIQLMGESVPYLLLVIIIITIVGAIAFAVGSVIVYYIRGNRGF